MDCKCNVHLLYSFSIFWTCGCLAKLCLQAGSEFSSQLSGPAPSQEVLHSFFWHGAVKLASSLFSNIWICSQLKERQDGCSTEDNNGEAIRLIG